MRMERCQRNPLHPRSADAGRGRADSRLRSLAVRRRLACSPAADAAARGLARPAGNARARGARALRPAGRGRRASRAGPDAHDHARDRALASARPDPRPARRPTRRRRRALRGADRVLEVAPHQFDEAFALYREIAAALGDAERGRATARRIGDPLARISAAQVGKRRPLVAALVSLEPLELAGGHSFVSDLVEVAGAETLTHASEARARCPRASTRSAPPRPSSCSWRCPRCPAPAAQAAVRSWFAPVPVAFLAGRCRRALARRRARGREGDPAARRRGCARLARLSSSAAARARAAR